MLVPGPGMFFVKGVWRSRSGQIFLKAKDDLVFQEPNKSRPFYNYRFHVQYILEIYYHWMYNYSCLSYDRDPTINRCFLRQTWMRGCFVSCIEKHFDHMSIFLISDLYICILQNIRNGGRFLDEL